jgi:hypothetical protein
MFVGQTINFSVWLEIKSIAILNSLILFSKVTQLIAKFRILFILKTGYVIELL